LLVAEAPEECGDLIKLGLTDLNAQVRVAALSSLADGVPAEGALLPLVLRLCEDVNHSVRLEAVQAAARFWGQSDEVTAMLARVARADPLQLRRTALEALASLRPGDSATRTALVCGRRDPIDVVRYAAYKLDAALFGARPDVLDPALLDPYLRIRQIAADLVVALGRVGDEPGRPAAIRNTLLRTSGEGLREAVSDPEASVRRPETSTTRYGSSGSRPCSSPGPTIPRPRAPDGGDWPIRPRRSAAWHSSPRS
jgi:hypothetical protein